MSKQSRARRERLLSEADGYLDLDMAEQAHAALDAIDVTDDLRFRVCFLRGLAFRSQHCHERALEYLEQAYAIVHQPNTALPDTVPLLMALAWCYKRTDQLPRSIEMMDEAYRLKPKEAVVLYNLACYWCLSGNKSQALSWLGRAIRLDKNFRQLVADETDFDSLRHDPDFQLIVGKPDEVSP